MTVYKLRHFPTGEFYNRKFGHTPNGAIYNGLSAVKNSMIAFVKEYNQCQQHDSLVWTGDNPDEYELVTYELVEVTSERIHLEDLV